MITTFSTLEPARIDRFRYMFREHGQDFDYWLVKCMNGQDHFIFSSPYYFMMGWAQFLPEDGFEDMPGAAWVVYFMWKKDFVPLIDIVNMMPFHLPYIAFVRGLRRKKDLKFYETDRLKEVCKWKLS